MVIVRCPVCKWEGPLPSDVRCPNGHDLAPWEPLMIDKPRMCGCGHFHRASERCGPW